MGMDICEGCGREIEPRNAVRKHIIPDEVAESFGIPDTRPIILCSKCSTQLYDWYHKRVSTAVYDDKIQQFRARTPAEILKEYESVFNSFVKYKRGRQKRIKRL